MATKRSRPAAAALCSSRLLSPGPDPDLTRGSLPTTAFRLSVSFLTVRARHDRGARGLHLIRGDGGGGRAPAVADIGQHRGELRVIQLPGEPWHAWARPLAGGRNAARASMRTRMRLVGSLERTFGDP